MPDLSQILTTTANTWSALQTFSAAITGTGTTGTLTAGTGILGTANTFTATQTFPAASIPNSALATPGAALSVANTWTALQTYSAGLTVSAGVITFDTVPQTKQGGSNSNAGYGTYALSVNTGINNSGFGTQALDSNTGGICNSGFGGITLYSNTLGNCNSAFGYGALNNYTNTGGTNSYLVAIGYFAGANYNSAETGNTTLGGNVTGTAGESNTLRIGGPNGTLLLGNMTGVASADYLSVAGRFATGNGGVAPTAVVVPASGTAYTPSTLVNTELFVSGGTVTVVAINGVNVGLLSGHVYMKANDTITFTYTVAPTVYQMNA